MAILIFHLYVNFIAVQNGYGVMPVQDVEMKGLAMESKRLTNVTGQR